MLKGRILCALALSCACTQARSQQVVDPGPVRAHPRLLLPALRPALERRVKAGAPSWKAVQTWCDANATVPVWWPDQGGDADGSRIAGGYQGSDYMSSLLTLGLCWQLTHKPAYAKQGVEVLVKMSAPDAPHAPNPLHDDGYGIRFYGVGMAVGYDWFYDALKPDQRKRVYEALNRWIEAYDAKGFEKDHPVGNYFAGYYAAGALAALATEGENPRAPAQWQSWYRRHQKLVAPYFAAHLRGGGWPEGWNYGPLAVVNLSLAVLGVQTAKGVDLLPGFRFPVEEAQHLIHFTWPTRRTLDDRGAQYPGDNPSRADPTMATVLAGLLELWKQPLAPAFHRYAREVRASAGGDPTPRWAEFLFWDASAPEADYRSSPLSFFAAGMNTVAMRSSWDAGAVWASFTAGPYVCNSGSGEMYFDQGSLAIVRGGEPFLVNTVAALNRNRPGTKSGDDLYDPIYADLFGDNDKDRSQANRTLFNIFYAHASHFGQFAADLEKTRTHVDRFEDGGGYVVVRGTRLEDLYRQPHHGVRPVVRWTRQVTYLRPQLFVIDDRTRAVEGTDQWLAWHFGGALTAVDGKKFHVAAGKTFLGAVTTVLPQGAQARTTDLFGAHKVYRLELRPGQPGAEQRWLTVLDAAARPEEVAAATPISTGKLIGVRLIAPQKRAVVLAAAGEDAVGGAIEYLGPPGPTSHVLTDLEPGARYQISVSVQPDGQQVRLSPGGGRAVSERGILSFTTDAKGAVR